jgi:hypothetical protein
MKKSLLSLCLVLLALGYSTHVNAQCLTTTAPTENCSFGDAIDFFRLNGITSPNSPGCSATSAGYGNYAATVWTLQIGGAYSWSATVGTTGSYVYNEGVTIWIDLNNDGIYASTEVVATSAPANYHSGTINIPYSAVGNVSVRMRVRCAYNSAPAAAAACNNGLGSGYGETEDYTVFLTCPSSAVPSPTVANSTTATPVCGGNSVTLIASGFGTYTWTGGVSNNTAFATNLVNTTYTVTAGVSGCPSATSTAVTTVSVLPTPTIGGVSSGSICPGASYVVTPSGASTYSYISSSTVTGASATLQPLTSTSYTIKGTGANGCASLPAYSQTITVTTLSAPALTVAATSGTICNGNTTSVTVAGANTYTWAPQTSNASTLAVTPSVTTIYTVSGTGTNVCNGINTVVVTVNQLPTITVNSGTICSGYSITLSPTGAGTNGTYTITGSSGTVATIVSPAASANYTITGTNSNGCISNAASSAINTVVVIPSPTIVASSGSVCVGLTYSILPTGASTYSINGVSTTTVGGVSPVVNTTYTVSGTGTNNCVSPAPNRAIITVSAIALPSVGITTSTTGICVSQATAVLTATGAATYSWNTTASTSSIAVSPTSTSVYSVVGTSSVGCLNSNTVSITVYTLPVVFATPLYSFVCVGGPSTITASGTNSYLWNNGSTLTSIAVNPTVTTTYTVVGTSTAGCTTTVTAVVNVNTLSLNMSPTSTVCLGSVGTVSASGAVTYTWNNQFGFQVFQVQPTARTVYTVIATDVKGCILSGTAAIDVYQLPNITVTPSSNKICAGESATITAGGATSYTWSNSNTNGTSITVTPSVSVVYNYSVTGTDNNGCIAGSSANLTVSACTGLKENNTSMSVRVYPNPSNGDLTVETDNNSVKTIQVIDLTGRTVLSDNGTDVKVKFNLGNLANGIYYVKVTSEGKTEVLKVVKN